MELERESEGRLQVFQLLLVSLPIKPQFFVFYLFPIFFLSPFSSQSLESLRFLSSTHLRHLAPDHPPTSYPAPMDSSGGGGCCRCCFSFIFTLGLTALFMWLSLRTSNPTCSVQLLYFPALNRTLNNPRNTTVYLNLKLDNGNKDKGIFYDKVNLTLSYLRNISDPKRKIVINDTFIPAFYQGHKKKATKPVNFSAAGLNWTAVRENPTAFFRVDLVTAVRFKIMVWKTKRNRLVVGANVEVNDSGGKVKKKGVKLSAAGLRKNGCFSFKIGVLFNFLIWVLLSFW